MQNSIKKTWIWLFILLIIFVSTSIVLGSGQPKEYAPYLSTSPAPTGLKAFYTYLEEEHGAVQRFEQEPSKLGKEGNKLLVMVEPALISEQKIANDYKAFMETGSTILLFKKNLEGMFGISMDFAFVIDETVSICDPSGNTFDATMTSELRIIPDDGDELLLEDEQGVVAIKRPFGEGNLIAVNAPDWLSNHYISEEDHINLVLRLMEEESYQEILFDDYSHRASGATGISDIYPMWLLVAVLQLGLFTLLGLLYKGKRFGPIRVPREDYVRFSDERVTALAAWYQKGKIYQDSLATQAEYVRSILREKWGISYQKEWRDLYDRLSVKLKQINDEELTAFLNGIEGVLQKNNLSKQEYLLWAKRMDRLRKEVEQG